MKPLAMDETYRLAGNLLRAILDADPVELSVFGVTPAIHQEIIEELDSSGENPTTLTIAPYALAFEADRSGRAPLCSYPLDADPQSSRVECQLWSGGKKTDLTLIADYSAKPGETSLTFRLLETQ